MTVQEKIKEIGKNFPYDMYIVITIKNNVARIVDFTSSLKYARSYVELGRKNGMPVYIAEHNGQTGEISYDIH